MQLLLLSLSFLLILIKQAFSGSVSVSTASDPAGWCDPLQGTPTRTTGECICKKDCIGPGCQRAQGFIWFAYESCPTCKCTGVTAAASSDQKEKELKNLLSGKSSRIILLYYSFIYVICHAILIVIFVCRYYCQNQVILQALLKYISKIIDIALLNMLASQLISIL